MSAAPWAAEERKRKARAQLKRAIASVERAENGAEWDTAREEEEFWYEIGRALRALDQKIEART